MNRKDIYELLHLILVTFTALYLILFLSAFTGGDQVTVYGKINSNQETVIINFFESDLNFPKTYESTDNEFNVYAKEHNGDYVKCDILVYDFLFKKNYVLIDILYGDNVML